MNVIAKGRGRLFPFVFSAAFCFAACLLSSCGNNEQHQHGTFVMPTAEEYEQNQVDSLRLAPTIKFEDGTRIPLDNSLKLTDREGNPLSWASIGIGLTVSVSKGNGQTTAVVDGNSENAIYLWHGTMLYAEDYAFFQADTKPRMNFMYSHPFQTRVEHVAMKLCGTNGTIEDIVYQPEGISVFFSPFPSNFIGFEVFD